MSYPPIQPCSNCEGDDAFSMLLTRFNSLETIIDGMLIDQEALKTQVAGLTATLNRYAMCIDRLCPPRQILTPIHYIIGTPQLFSAGLGHRINFDTKISDTTPPSVTTGPLWRASLIEAVYEIEVQLILRAAATCAGKYVQLSLNLCGEILVIDQITLTGQLTSITLYGKTTQVLTRPCDLHVLVETNDPTVPAHVIETGFIRIRIAA